MRWAISLTVLVVAGCGNYSNDDIAFLDALPSRDALQVSVPQAGSALGQQASLYTGTVKSAQDIDAGVEKVLALIDLIRTISPSRRTENARVWGPFRDHDLAFEDQVTITRTAEQSYAYVFGQRPVGQGAFAAVLTGTFVGATAGAGHGTLDYDPGALRSIGNPSADPNLEGLHFAYANDGQPRQVQTRILARGVDGGGAELDYTFAQSTAEGDLDWEYGGPTPDAGRFDLRVHSRIRGDGAGRADARGTVEAQPGLEWRVTQCWDATFAERYADSNIVRLTADGGASVVVAGYLCEATEGQACPAGAPAACPF